MSRASRDSYLCIFSSQMEAIAFIILQIFLRKAVHFGRPLLKGFKNVACLLKILSSIQLNNFSWDKKIAKFENWGKSLGSTSRDVFRPIARENI